MKIDRLRQNFVDGLDGGRLLWCGGIAVFISDDSDERDDFFAIGGDCDFDGVFNRLLVAEVGPLDIASEGDDVVWALLLEH